MKDFEAILQRNVVVPVFFHHSARGLHDLRGFLFIAGLGRAQRGHLHVRTHGHGMIFHRVHGVRPALVVG